MTIFYFDVVNMNNVITTVVPDIGDFDEVEVIEVLVAVGDSIQKEDSLITLESDKASMEIPADSSGVVKEMHIKVGDKVKKGSKLLDLIVSEEKAPTTEPMAKNTSTVNDLVVPDIGDFDAVEVIEVLVSAGDSIEKEDSLITLESDKASMEIPSSFSGVIESVNVKIGDKVKQGDLIGRINAQENIEKTKTITQTSTQQTTQQVVETPIHQQVQVSTEYSSSHSSPSIRKLARELGVDLSKVQGTGEKNRVLESDLKYFVKNIIQNGGAGEGLPKVPQIDFSKIGEIESQPLSRINKLSGKHLTACWLNIPHVTQFDEANIDNMENYRQEQKKQGVKLTPLVFIMKSVVQVLEKYPKFNASLDNENLILKKYFNLGIAVNTPNGLVVPVIRDVNKKSLLELATELGEVSVRAREGKLTTKDLSGGCMTISSLGGIGGTQFTPIVNAPEVAILGVSRSYMKPVWDGKEFKPQLTLPLALSYDHRVIDGAQGAEFITALSQSLADVEGLL
ncbi:Dihydrolipoamide acetyltransferase component of pyruvate dehydrogenase complex [hydrothermal vent metagenome]|uniref:Dihydrolipoyllysine-residue acetyltransferase component of pyruvate dehydrogenase complex n=1 Tax=hydrothermal vent metagenome TaxID=652676 RepID=A0A1W1CKM4_9ZZZZ